eukprot:TRINITY_DN357_c0_g2_i1.p1 TRINITY_DN357_c0_g2~~TRINITY_DN357_c0_g2_i1.p1  ORF type:complete len:531 (-),score=72.03 TRINITY_DN357_c0_g2_i1:202-1656(-)
MKGIRIVIGVILSSVIVLAFSTPSSLAYPSPEELEAGEDFVVIEASSRNSRQFPIFIPSPGGLCTTSRGRSGRCISFSSCYPFYRVRRDLPGWAYGRKDACSPQEAMEEWDHNQGICCENLYQPVVPQGLYPIYPFQPIFIPALEGPILGDLTQLSSSTTSSSSPTTTPTRSTTIPSTTTISSTSKTTTADDPKTTTSSTPTTTFETPTSDDVCGNSIHYPILYTDNGDVSEELNRIDMEHDLKIVNGWPASKHEWPWIAALFNSGRQFCGGSLISKNHILTAAHCVVQMTRMDVSNLEVRLGDHDIKDAFDTEVVVRKVKKIVRHKGFSSQTLWNDVALVFLSEPVEYGDTIKPICLDTSDDLYEQNDTATVVGWGSIKEKGPQPSVLQEVTLRLWSNEKCNETYGDSSPAGITEHMICAGKQGKDSCSGDSGGPMMKAKGDKWFQIGIVSWGIGCGKSHYPGVYTRVAKMHEWISNVMEKFM